MSEFSQRLSVVRKKLDLTQQEIADRFQITRSAYGAWENGRNEPPFSFVRDFCRAYRISADYLLGLSENIEPAQIVSIETKIVPRDPLASLPDEVREDVEDYLELRLRRYNERNRKKIQP